MSLATSAISLNRSNIDRTSRRCAGEEEQEEEVEAAEAAAVDRTECLYNRRAALPRDGDNPRGSNRARQIRISR